MPPKPKNSMRAPSVNRPKMLIKQHQSYITNRTTLLVQHYSYNTTRTPPIVQHYSYKDQVALGMLSLDALVKKNERKKKKNNLSKQTILVQKPVCSKREKCKALMQATIEKKKDSLEQNLLEKERGNKRKEIKKKTPPPEISCS